MRTKLKGAVREIRSNIGRNPLIAVIEAVVNSIQAAESPNKACIEVTVVRDPSQTIFLETDQPAPKTFNGPVVGFKIADNGCGFTEDNLESFMELFSDFKQSFGCKGVGRISWLAVFERAEIESDCSYNGDRHHISFTFDEDNEVSEPKVGSCINDVDCTTVTLVNIRKDYFKKVNADTRKLSDLILNNCLSYYVSGNSPQIKVHDGDRFISVSDMFSDLSKKTDSESITLKGRDFMINHFLVTSSKSDSKGRLQFCADQRMVTETSILEGITLADSDGRHYRYIASIQGSYLNENVSLDRLSLSIPKEGELHNPKDPTVEDIIGAVEERALSFLESTVQGYEEKRKRHVEDFVNRNPQFRYVLSHDPDIVKKFSFDTEDKVMFSEFNRQFADLESRCVFDFDAAVNGTMQWGQDDERTRIFNSINDIQKATLAKYITHRRFTIDLFEKKLRSYEDADGEEKYVLESEIHDILMPRHTTSKDLTFDNCNLWMLDERLFCCSFTNAYSDVMLKKFTSLDAKDRPDICIFSDAYKDCVQSVTIVEFKRPGRSDWDALKQVKDYVIALKDCTVKDFHGRPVKVSSDVVFNCYVLCDIDEKRYAEYLKSDDFKRLFGGRGYYKWYYDLSAFIEFVDYDHLLSDMKIRNTAFFDLLKIGDAFEKDRYGPCGLGQAR